VRIVSLWDRIHDWWGRNAAHSTAELLETGDGGGSPIRPEKDYLRVWLSDMFLARDRAWFRDRHPAVHASVRLTFANRPGLEFTAVAAPPDGMLGPGERRDYPLTPLIPYSGGVVEVEAGLSALQGGSELGAAIDVLQGFSKLLVPPLEQVLDVVEMVSGGIDRLVAAGADGVVLGTHAGFRSASAHNDDAAPDDDHGVLRSGYLAVVNAPPEAIGGPLVVHKGQLGLTRDARFSRLTGFDYMLFRIERRGDRDDWRFADLEALKNQAIRTMLTGPPGHYEAFRDALYARVLESPDLTVADRTRAVTALRDELEKYETAGRGAAPLQLPSIGDILAASPMTAEEAALIPLPTLAQLTGGARS
jgi:hypothetical protein